MRALLFLLLILTIACQSQQKEDKSLAMTKANHVSDEPLSKGEQIINQAIRAHGGELYDQASYEFVFRNNTYRFSNDGDLYTYQVVRQKDGNDILDILDNEGLSRTINGEPVELSDKDYKRYEGALNSVIYFATLPHKLQDKAVFKTHMGTTSIKGKDYEVVKITFSEEGGGQDHDDTYYYWIGIEDHLIDYLAYNYQVNKGGVRFREAYNRRNVEGIIFQDYVNYRAEVGTPLADLPKLLENGKLEELSKIETEQVIMLE